MLAACATSPATTVDAAPQSVAAKSEAVKEDVQPEGNATRKKDPNRMVCVSDIPTGTRIRRGKTCKRQSEWDRIRERDQQDLDELRNRTGRAFGEDLGG